MVKTLPKDEILLPCDNWEISDSFVGDVEVLGKKINLSGIEASSTDGIQVVGSAGCLEKSPFDRSFFELIERITIIEALKKGPSSVFELKDLEGNCLSNIDGKKTFGIDSFQKNDHYQIAKSNGIALHDTWSKACYSAAAELVERHHILASWFGKVKVENLDVELDGKLDFLKDHYDISCYKLGESMVRPLNETLTTTILSLKPKNENLDKMPLVYAFSCENNLADALKGATKEILQRLGFLWGEGIPKKPLKVEANAQFHGDYYLAKENHKFIDMWLANEFFEGDSSFLEKELKIEFVDIGSSSVSKYEVAKAISKDTIDLYFGSCDLGIYGECDEKQKFHPIP